MHLLKKISPKILALGIVTALVAALFLWPLPAKLMQPESRAPTRVTDRHGQLLYELRHPDFGTQSFLPLTEIPPNITTALLATEDRTFFTHPGVSLRGILRAARANWQAGRIVAGGSTITQQLVRIRLQPTTRGYLYKLKEAYFALRLEHALTKNEILESYLNTAYFGHQAYGLSAASQTYFGKNVSELSLAEGALLVGLLQAPDALDPFANSQAAIKRQKTVLTALGEIGEITAENRANAEVEPLRLARDTTLIRAPHFVLWLLRKYAAEVAAATEIQTTLDLNLQTEIELIVTNELEKLADKNVTNAAVVVLDTRTGELLAEVGSADYFDDAIDGQVNIARAARQPGSALKPFVYALALARGDTAATTVSDIETQFFTAEGNPYTPRNYDYGYHGLVRYREALANSYNIAAVKVLEKVGVAKLLNLLHAAGLTTLSESPEHYGLALALGDGEVRLIELAAAYGIFVRGGATLPVQVLATEKTPPSRQILAPAVAWLVADILSDDTARLPEFGADSALSFDFPVAAKTGTTRNSRDNWTLGITPERVVGVWVGNADNSPMRGTSGVTGAGPIFHAVMETAMRDLPKRNFPQPNGIVAREICALSGKLPTEHCPARLTEKFLRGTEPREPDDIFQTFAIDKRNGQLAGASCPPQFVANKVLAVFPLELKKWARENGWPTPPTEFSELCPREIAAPAAEQSQQITITKPNPGDSFLLDPLVPDESEKIVFEAETNNQIAAIDWLIDGEKVGTGHAPSYRIEWSPTVGSHEIAVDGFENLAKITIKVVK
jgi:penicillin-binding protein 1C